MQDTGIMCFRTAARTWPIRQQKTGRTRHNPFVKSGHGHRAECDEFVSDKDELVSDKKDAG